MGLERRNKNRLPHAETSSAKPAMSSQQQNDNNDTSLYSLDSAVWLAGSVLFAKAIIFLLEDDEGIVLKVDSKEMKEGFPNIDLAVVFKKNGMIHVAPIESETDLQEGDFITMSDDGFIDDGPGDDDD